MSNFDFSDRPWYLRMINASGWLMLGVAALAAAGLYVLMSWHSECKRFETQTVETLNGTRFRSLDMPLTTVHKIKVCVER